MTEGSHSIDISGCNRILVVDDEEANRRLLKIRLEKSGFEVELACDGEEALTAVAKNPPDVVLLDVTMPKIDGFEVCRRIKDDPATAHIPVLLVTALTDRQSRLKGIESGANDFIPKQMDGQEVVLRTRNAAYSKSLHDKVQESLARLQELEQLRDNLTRMIVHDLRSPLTGVQGFQHLLKRRAGDSLDEKSLSYVEKSLASLSTLVEMIDSLLDVSRLEAGKMSLDMIEVDMKEVADQASDALGGTLDAVDFTADLPVEPVPVRCDGTLIRRVITNLLGNAARFTSQGGALTLKLEDAAEEVRVSVIDSGPGIPPEYHDRIFEKFGQVEAKGEGRKSSTGLGLTFCKMVVQAHGGSIGVQSEVDKGSTFWFCLPKPDHL